MTRKEFSEMSFEDFKFGNDVSIGRSFERKRFIEKFSSHCSNNYTYSELCILVKGRSKDGIYTTLGRFPHSSDGFEQAKKFALK